MRGRADVTRNGWYNTEELKAVVEEQARLGELGDGRQPARRQAWLDAGGAEIEARAAEAERQRLDKLREEGEFVWTVRRAPHCSGFWPPYGSGGLVPSGGTVRPHDLVGTEVLSTRNTNAINAKAREEATRHIRTTLVPPFAVQRDEALAKVRELNLTRDDWRAAVRRYENWQEDKDGADKYLMALVEVDFPVPPYGTWEDFDRDRRREYA